MPMYTAARKCFGIGEFRNKIPKEIITRMMRYDDQEIKAKTQNFSGFEIILSMFFLTILEKPKK